MTTKQRVQQEFNLAESAFSHYQSDLMVLFRQDVYDWLMQNYGFPKNIKVWTSNVKGQTWYAKRVIELPFAFDKEKDK